MPYPLCLNALRLKNNHRICSIFVTSDSTNSVRGFFIITDISGLMSASSVTFSADSASWNSFSCIHSLNWIGPGSELSIFSILLGSRSIIRMPNLPALSMVKVHESTVDSMSFILSFGGNIVELIRLKSDIKEYTRSGVA